MRRDLLANWQDGRIKLYLLHKLLSFRRAHAEFFAEGDYVPLESTTGPMDDRICAFARRQGAAWAVAVVPRLIGEMVYNGGAPVGEILGRERASSSTGCSGSVDRRCQWRTYRS